MTAMTKDDLVQTAAPIAAALASAAIAKQQGVYVSLGDIAVTNIARDAITMALRIETEAAKHLGVSM